MSHTNLFLSISIIQTQADHHAGGEGQIILDVKWRPRVTSICKLHCVTTWHIVNFMSNGMLKIAWQHMATWNFIFVTILVLLYAKRKIAFNSLYLLGSIAHIWDTQVKKRYVRHGKVLGKVGLKQEK